MIKKVLQYPFLVLAPLIPAPLAKAIYLLPFFIIKTFFLRRKEEVWFRHSVYFGDIQFAISDLDLTIILHSEPGEKRAVHLQKRIDRLSFFFPFIGEIAYYDQDFLALISPFMNRCELLRDPVLKKRLGIGEQNLAEKQVFILNWLAYDAHKMRESFSSRQKKIRRFLSLLCRSDLYENTQSIEDLVKSLDREFFKKEQWLSFLLEFTFYDFTGGDTVVNEFYKDFPEYRRIFMITFPQRWMGAALHFDEFEQGLKLVGELRDNETNVFLAQINWEICGLMGQCKKKDNVVNLLIHCENLLRLLEPIKDKAYIQVAGLKQLCQWQEHHLHSEVDHAS